MDITALKLELTHSPPIEKPTAETLATLRQELDRALAEYRTALIAASKWEAVCEDLARSPIEELYYAIEVNRGRALSVLGRQYLDDVHTHAEAVLAENVAGDFCEAGVFRGGVAILLAAILAQQPQHAPQRLLWAADSFAGLPIPSLATDSPAEIVSFLVLRCGGGFFVSLGEVEQSFERFGLWSPQVRLLPGWFEDSLPAAPIEALALLRVDCQYGRSTRTVLECLYPKLSPGGRLLLNDFGHGEYWGARAEIDAYRARHGITNPITTLGHTAWWQK